MPDEQGPDVTKLLPIPADPYTTLIATAATAVAKAIEAENLLDIKLIEIDQSYAKVVIEERTNRKEFWNPFWDFFKKLKGGD
jgi:hypothetical protein